MEFNHDLEIVLKQIESPAFLVQAHQVCTVNSSAAQLNICPEQNISELIVLGVEEYSNFRDGSLYLTVSINGVNFDCSVSKLQDFNLFVLEDGPSKLDLQVLSLAAKQLSFPLSELSILFSTAVGIEDVDKERINRVLFQLHRITNNMSDAVQLQKHPAILQTTEICSVFEEIFEKAKTLFTDTPIDIQYTLPNTPIYAPASSELLERAVYNLISNAAKYGTKRITASLTRAEDRAYFSIINTSASEELRHSMFTRYKRAPGLEDPRYGLGLGMTLVHAIAKSHGGTVLVETNADNIKITMTISLKPLKASIVRSHIVRPDIFCGRDRALVELSDILPPHLYKNI